MKVVIVTPIWQRPLLSTTVIASWRKWNSVDFDVVIVGSEGEKSRSLHKHLGHYLEFPNQPLGAKFNAGVRFAQRLDFDYLMIMGSDQVCLGSIWSDYLPLMEEGHAYIGVLDLYVIDTIKNKALYWPGYVGAREGTPIGPGRLVRRDVLDELDWTLYEPKRNHSLDLTMDDRLPEPVTFLSREHRMASVKTAISITPAERYDIAKPVGSASEFMGTCFPSVRW